MRWALLAIIVTALLVPASAPALTYRQARALSVADVKWGQLPCEGAIVFATGSGTMASGEALAPCTILFNGFELPMMHWSLYCTLVVHEVGHLLGYGHSPDPRSVMYPAPSEYWRCRHSWRWSLAHPSG